MKEYPGLVWSCDVCGSVFDPPIGTEGAMNDVELDTAHFWEIVDLHKAKHGLSE